MLEVGRQRVGKMAEVTVSVSSHVPKPHTPLQWCAQDPEGEIVHKQGVLRAARREPGLKLKYHHSGISWVEGILARGDRRLADVVEDVWRAGARFDGWDEVMDTDRWRAALTAHGVDVPAYLGTRPVGARLPWDHIDVGLEDGFLLGEYRKALKGRASPPCGKVAGTLLHHSNVADAEADARRLVCYDCGVACDLSKMRGDRIVALRALGAARRPAAAPRPAPEKRTNARRERVLQAGHHGADRPFQTWRIRFTKLGRTAFLGHLDLMRLLARCLRRADLPVAVSRGFSPKPRITFGPALGLGVPSLGELLDVDLEHAPGALDGEDLRARLAAVCPAGLEILSALPVARRAPGLGKLIVATESDPQAGARRDRARRGPPGPDRGGLPGEGRGAGRPRRARDRRARPGRRGRGGRRRRRGAAGGRARLARGAGGPPGPGADLAGGLGQAGRGRAGARHRRRRRPAGAARPDRAARPGRGAAAGRARRGNRSGSGLGAVELARDLVTERDPAAGDVDPAAPAELAGAQRLVPAGVAARDLGHARDRDLGLAA